MKIVYYYILYLRKDSSKTPGKSKVEIHMDPFDTQKAAEEYKKKADEHYGDAVWFSCIKKVDLAKHEKGIWLK